MQYTYYENVSKTSNGSFKQLHVKSKVVPVFACPEAGEKCSLYILDLYLNKLSKEGTQDVFYHRPLENIPLDPSLPWYASVPVGRDTLHKKMSTLCKLAGVQGRKTNQCKSNQLNKDVQEKHSRENHSEHTGHRSLESLRCYERTSDAQHKTVSNILLTGNPKTQLPSTSKTAHYSAISDTGVHQQQSMYTTPSKICMVASSTL